MKIAIDSTFSKFIEELDAQVESIESDSSLLPLEKKSSIRKHRRLCYAVASKCFFKELKELLTRLGILSRFDEISEHLTKKLDHEKIRYNIFDELGTLQIIRPGDLEHQRYIEPDVIVKSFFGITPNAREYNLLLGFTEDKKINEILQLAFHLVPGAMLP